jgi:hypothetical protein
MYKYELGKATNDGEIEGVGFIPLNLQLTMDGLSGPKIYEVYTIDETLLPLNYKNKIQFIIKGISHKIDDNGWVTTLESLGGPRNEKLKVSGRKSFTVTQRAPNVGSGGGGGANSGSSSGTSANGCTTKYPDLPIFPTFTKTYTSYSELKALAKKYYGDTALAKNIFITVYQESGKENNSFRSAGYYNMAGVQVDNSKWGGGVSKYFIGQFCRVDSGGNRRMFGAFENADGFVQFTGDRLKAKGFESITTAEAYAKRYLNTWVYQDLETRDPATYNSLYPQKVDIYKGAEKRWNNA